MRDTDLNDYNGRKVLEGSKVRSLYKDNVVGTVMFGKYKTGCTCDTYTDSHYGFYILDNYGKESSLYGYGDKLWFTVI
jgi:hypothetical protein